MDRAAMLYALAAALYMVSLVELGPGFAAAPSISGRSLRGNSGFGAQAEQTAGSTPLFWRPCIQTASVVLALGACTKAGGRAAGLKQGGRAAQARTALKAMSSPILVYMTALSKAAEQQGQSVNVTKDVMMVKGLFMSEEFMEKVGMILNTPGLNQMEQATSMLELIGKLESKVFAKFVTYLAKKRRLLSLRPICEEFIKNTYTDSSIIPVRVTSAIPLTPDQKETLKTKMAKKTGATDIKLVTQVDAALLAGMIVEWGFVDPERLITATEGEDLSLKNILAREAILKGVTPTDI